MYQAYLSNTQGASLATNQDVDFNVEVLDTDCRISSNGTNIKINKPGRYLVEFSSIGYNTGAASTPDSSDGTYSFQLNNNSIPVVSGAARSASTADTDIANVYFSTIVTVRPSCCMVDNNANLTVTYLGQAGTVFLANIIITKLS